MGLAETVKEWYADAREEGREEGFEKGEILGAEKERAKTIKKMLMKGMPLEDISDITGLSLQEIEKYRNQ